MIYYTNRELEYKHNNFVYRGRLLKIVWKYAYIKSLLF